MAKLPDISLRQIRLPTGAGPGLARQKAANRRAIAEGIQGVADQAAQFYEKRQLHDATIGSLEDMRAFESEYAGRPTVTAEELSSEGLQGDDREEVPIHEVGPAILQRRLESSINERAEQIKSPRARREWREKMEIKAAGLVSQATESAAKAQRQYEFNSSRRAIDQAESLGAWETIPDLVEQMPVDRATKQDLLLVYDQKHKAAQIDELAATGSYEEIGAAIEFILSGEETGLTESLEQNALSKLRTAYTRTRREAVGQEEELLWADWRTGEPDQMTERAEELLAEDYDGALNGAQRATWAQRLNEGARQSMNLRNSAEATAMALAERKLKDTTKLLQAGVVIDPQDLNAASETATLMEAEAQRTGKGAPASVIDYADALQKYNDLVIFQNQPLSDMSSQLGDMRSSRRVDDLQMVDLYEEAYQKKVEDLNTDSLSYYERYQGTTVEPLPQMDQMGFVEALQARMDLDDLIFAEQGASAGPLRESEVEVFANYSGDPVALATTVQAALGERSRAFWDQVTAGKGGTPTVAGEIAARPGTDQEKITNARHARTIMSGRSARAEIDWTQSHYKAVKAEIMDEIQGAYGVMLGKQGTAVEAITDHYLGTLVNRQQLDNLRVSGEGVDIDRDALEDSIGIVTGGLISVDGVMHLTPEQGVEARDFNRWLRTLTSEDMPPIANVNSEELLKLIQDGDVTLRPSIRGRGYYELYYSVTDGTLPSGYDHTQPALLQWPGVRDVTAAWEAKRARDTNRALSAEAAAQR